MNTDKLLNMLLEAIDYSFLQTDGSYDKILTYPVIDKIQYIKEKVKDAEVKEVNLELVTDWFDHIVQIADDRMTLTNQKMTDAHALDEIKCLAKNSSEFITRHYKTQKKE